jgi:hypothetical protein
MDAAIPLASDATPPQWPDATPPVTPDAGVECTDGGYPIAYLLGPDGAFSTFEPATLTTTRIGAPDCGDPSQPWEFTVSQEGNAYVIYRDWRIFEVNLATLACAPTTFALGSSGLIGGFTSTVAPGSAGSGEDMLFVGQWGNGAAPVLARSDLTSFVPTEVGPLLPWSRGEFPIDIKADATGRIFALTANGVFLEIDPENGAVISSTVTTFASTSFWALLLYEGQVYFFNGSEVSRYDVGSNTVSPLGSVGQAVQVTGASAAPCVHP